MKGAIFDIDGTLLDSQGVWNEVTAKFFTKHNLILTPEKALTYKEMTLEESLPQINEEFGLGMTFEEIMEEFRIMIVEEYAHNIRLKPNADKYLRKLHENGVKIAVATSGYIGVCELAFRRLGIFDCIDAYAYSSEVGCNKGKPDVYLLAAKRIGVKPQDAAVFEDLLQGIKTAKKAGFKAYAIYDKTNEAETELLKESADVYISDWKELL